ncbi:TRAP transporter small permease [Limimaricola pyoseonensis]|uniref:TRAP transporter small permease protein n=1 Tax=Limimaricola pyoseonensis TaxID=521013 RepID=A0A1G7JHX8_9RHOB|nr:TRAP transporter small permease [Limimaricola pyoseonensis]SDF24518.1 TRAP-type C4-dicarboxylate transport system, small permease component [Limimaricola pyoseonensis]
MTIGRILYRISAGLAWVERLMLRCLMLVIATFVLLNVLLRLFGITIAWADELAVYCMIMSGFVGASLMLRARIDPAVLLVHEVVPAPVARGLRMLVSALSAGFGITLFALCWRWFDPAALMQAGFDVPTFEVETFNFIYTDTTPVMAMPAYWFYLIMPWFALTLSVHALANLAEDAGLVARDIDPAGLDLQEAPL